MKINLLAKNLELTPKLKDYVLKKVTKLGRLLDKKEKEGGEVQVNFEVSKSTKHHKLGKVFHSDCVVIVDGDKFYLSANEVDIYKAIDEVKTGLFRTISEKMNRNRTLRRRGAKSVKKMMKGLSKRNPQTAKYDRTKQKAQKKN